MKTEHTKKQLQTAIDKACLKVSKGKNRPTIGLLDLELEGSRTYAKQEASARLELLKAALKFLP
jgi:hypothetical protein